MNTEEMTSLLLSVRVNKKKESLVNWLSYLSKKSININKGIPCFLYALPVYNSQNPVTFFKGGSFFSNVILKKEDVVVLEFLFQHVDMLKSGELGRIVSTTSLENINKLISSFSGINRLPDYIPTLSRLSFYISNTSGKHSFFFPIFESIITTRKKIEVVFSLDASLLYLSSERVKSNYPLGSEVVGLDITDESIFSLKYLNSLSSRSNLIKGVSLDETLKDFGISPLPQTVTKLLTEMITPPAKGEEPFIKKFNLEYSTDKNMFTPTDEDFSHIEDPFVSPNKLFNFPEEEEEASTSRTWSENIEHKQEKKSLAPSNTVFGSSIEPTDEEIALMDGEKKENTILTVDSSEEEKETSDSVKNKRDLIIFERFLKDENIEIIDAQDILINIRRFYKIFPKLTLDEEIMKKWSYREILRKKEIEDKYLDDNLKDQFYLLTAEHKKIDFLISSEEEYEEKKIFLVMEKMKEKNLSSFFIYPLSGVGLYLFINPDTKKEEFFYQWVDFEMQLQYLNKNSSRIPILVKEEAEEIEVELLNQKIRTIETVSFNRLPVPPLKIHNQGK